MKIPCEDCISLPMCLARTRDKIMIFTHLTRTCTLFEEYSKVIGVRHAIDEMFIIFGHWGPSVKKRVIKK